MSDWSEGTIGGDIYTDQKAGWDAQNYSAQFSAQAVNPAAKDWAQVFSLGISRAADYGIARVRMQNSTAAVRNESGAYTPVGSGRVGDRPVGSLSLGTIMLLALVGFVALQSLKD
jgi:hypothetical protein